MLFAMGVVPALGCNAPAAVGPSESPGAVVAALSFASTISSYFPPSETNGGWRKTTSATKIRSLGMDPAALAAFGAYNMSLPWEGYFTGVTGYRASNKASLVIKNGWIVGEYYNVASAKTAVYFLASNGKTFATMLLGRMLLDYPALGLTADSPLYDERWLPEGFPLSDSRKAAITFDQVFRHVSGIIPEVEAKVASKAVMDYLDWDFAPFTVGDDADYPLSARLYFDPGLPSSYIKGSTYSSVAFNHLSLVFKNVTALEPSQYLRQGMLDPIGVGRMAYVLPSGMGAYVWATAGNGLASARVPSLDLLATLNGRTPNSLRDSVTTTFLRNLFASVTQQYVTCDGRTVNGTLLATSQEVTAGR